jgi:hypothetical protein
MKYEEISFIKFIFNVELSKLNPEGRLLVNLE